MDRREDETKGIKTRYARVAVHGEGRTRFECTDEDARTV